MGLIVHHLGHSQSDRIVWLCEELGVDYELKKYDRAPALAPKDYKALHPLGAAPVIEDDYNGKQIVLAETGACLEYICNVHGGGKLLVKPGAPNYPDFLYWLHVSNGTLQPAAGRLMAMQLAGVDMNNPTFQRYLSKIHEIFEMLNERLGRTPYLGGEEFTAADTMAVFSLTTMREFIPIDLSKYTCILTYLQKIVKRPAYQSYLQKGDPDLDIEKFTQGPPPPLFAGFATHK